MSLFFIILATTELIEPKCCFCVNLYQDPLTPGHFPEVGILRLYCSLELPKEPKM